MTSAEKAAEVGLSQGRLEGAAALLQAEIDRGDRMSAAALFVSRGGICALARGFGHMRPESGAATVGEDAIFLVASPTKPVTAVAAMLLVEAGQLSLRDRVSQHIPEFRGPHKEKVTVRHLLTHTSGMPDMLPNNMALRQVHAPLSKFVEGAIRTPLLYEPGTDFRYQSKGVLLAAEIVEQISGKGLRDFEQERIFGPLGMNRTSLGLGGIGIAETVWCGTTVDESAYDRDCGWNTEYWRDLGSPWGGLHTTAPDLALLLQAMLDDGSIGERTVLSPAAARVMKEDQNPAHLEAPWGIGWGLRDSRVWNFFGDLVSAGTFGHVGATGTVAWADPQTDLVCIILTNKMVAAGSLLNRVSNAVAASVLE